ncbi:MAG: hypothetical protein EXQ74_03820 [Thermoleophilia bacterium]|nr:hypothetical protein [Thermoleophilia bacterium]
MTDLLVSDDADTADARAADVIADALDIAIALRGRASVALSGGTTPWRMIAHLVHLPLAWHAVDVLQVDERVAPDGDPVRNLSRLAPLIQESAASAATLHPMRVALGANAAIADYGRVLASLDGPIDVVHLGLGEDGHTASLTLGDPVPPGDHAPVIATTQPHDGTLRVTLSYPALNSAGLVVWLVTGRHKRDILHRLRAGDPSISAGRVAPRRAVLVADRAAVGDDR